ncbi:ABC-F family ATP-binding cassette domain-containing protein [Leucobacter sp. UT-8R-CII-1-4]|uniref:ABC-F family ATP-binding cassette domain-containing protein n=1 Tax=Leucobacter sp. UT-8R-CII-1-4 TaxID=3040075 RepID=UPI0024A80A4F|nr:ABC-F family ATP-binding cassette domain-containing protein [Leucobacter sp. UT-8R-CII-1-4]MDI6022010.1 ABC-F family ATP-binding cassette domain-containing protein [Leucobacter sp. UT-8R-CII-1-4]
MAHLLGAEGLHLEVPTKVVFDSVTLGVAEGDRIGIVGRNGDGKSSLLMMLAGRRDPDGGKVTVRSGTRIGVLDQEDRFDDGETVGHAIVGDVPEYEWASDARARDVIAGLVADLDWEAPVDSLSGGQRRRVALARLLVGDWEILALDEPTNHLDVEAIAWLADHLKRRWPANSGAMLAVTHDRWFLDEVANATWEVHDRIVEPFEGGYAAYILQRVERDRQAATIEQKRQNLARKELAWLRRGAPARTSKPKFRIDAANALIADVPEIRNATELKSLAVSRLGKEVVNLVEAGVQYGDRLVLEDVDWLLAPGERTGILGVNGAGKSTLLGLISGAVEPTSGRVKRGKTVKVATLTQRLDELEEHLNEPVRVVIGRLRTSFTVGTGSKAQDLTPGQMLEQMGFSSAQLSTPVKDLSGGQKRRLQLLLILLDQPNVLILDEPTNDLDTDILAAIEDLLDSWPGTLIVVSHDRYFIERVTDQQYAILDRKLRHLPGGIDEYLERRAAQEGAKAAGTSQGAAKATSSAASQTVDTASALSGAELRAAEKELSAVERKMEKLQKDIVKSRDGLAELDQSDYQLLGVEMAKITAFEDEVAALEERWLELSELLG